MECGEVIFRELASMKGLALNLKYAHLMTLHSRLQMERIAAKSAPPYGAIHLLVCEKYVTCMELASETYPWNSGECMPVQYDGNSLIEHHESSYPSFSLLFSISTASTTSSTPLILHPNRRVRRLWKLLLRLRLSTRRVSLLRCVSTGAALIGAAGGC